MLPVVYGMNEPARGSLSAVADPARDAVHSQAINGAACVNSDAFGDNVEVIGEVPIRLRRQAE